ncbi:hypothetical protein LGV61_12960 [Desulfurispirillum indicum]|uniref:hypothetical protein n=1 Tax=Desulfurispirillum indicum TaxID=936456 RepID=UPI001CF9E2A8|nr:hypothetical protein [Desulfurispirillum indicum]UCZ56621.1 hypothetical protein LGV61_12960 [Desulfurispirillum indicum]
MTERGSRKHVLDWTGSPSFLDELAELLLPAPVTFSADALYMPRGEGAPKEARLEQFGPQVFADSDLRGALRTWWLRHKSGANTPNWDIAAGCQLEGKPGMVLVEAKAHWGELSSGGKPLYNKASVGSRENHEQIGTAIHEACLGWQMIDSRVSISRNTHYQLANRLAFTWKLATLQIPTVLLYLGFTGDAGVGKPFSDDANWQNAFRKHTQSAWPADLLDRRLVVNDTPVWVVSRSRPIIEPSPPKFS